MVASFRSLVILIQLILLAGCAAPEELRVQRRHTYDWRSTPGHDIRLTTPGVAEPENNADTNRAKLSETEDASSTRDGRHVRLSVELYHGPVSELFPDLLGVHVLSLERRDAAIVKAELLRHVRLRRLTAPELTLASGRVASASVLARHAYISGWEVTTTPETGVADPIIDTYSTGESMEVRLLPGGPITRDATIRLEISLRSVRELTLLSDVMDMPPYASRVTTETPVLRGGRLTTKPSLGPDRVLLIAIDLQRGGEGTLLLLNRS